MMLWLWIEMGAQITSDYRDWYDHRDAIQTGISLAIASELGSPHRNGLRIGFRRHLSDGRYCGPMDISTLSPVSRAPNNALILSSSPYLPTQ